MNYPFQLPKTISNILGEEITFQQIVEENGVKKMLLSNRVAPQAGPPFHVHFKQDECLTVTRGRIGYQIKGQAERFAEAGETILFKAGETHRFWNAGEDALECSGWVMPANSIDFFLAALYDSVNKAGKPEGDPFDSAYLVTRYRSEYDVDVIPTFVKKVIMPITVFVGKLLGKYEHFKHAPEPLK